MERGRNAADQTVSRISTGQHGSDDQWIGYWVGRQVFEAMDGEVGLVVDEGGFEFLGEEAFWEFLVGEGSGLEFIAGGFDNFDLEPEFGEVGLAEVEDGVGLGEGEGAAAGGD